MTAHFRRYSSDEIAKLKGLAGKQRASEIAAELNRTRGSITVKAHQLKISLRLRTPETTPSKPQSA